MRSVAIAALALVLPLVPPVQADQFDECNSLTSTKNCHEIVLPTSPPSQTGRGTTYYLYAYALRCPVEKPGDSDCVGRQNTEHELPGGGGFGLVYEETNKYPGLQRFGITLPDGTKYPPDLMIAY